MKTTLRIPKNEIQALLPFISHDEVRIALNGIHVELRRDDPYPILVACDGRRLAVLRSDGDWQGNCGELFLPLDFLKQSLKFPLPKGGANRFTFQVIGSTVRTIVNEGHKLHVKLSRPIHEAELKYPKWRQVIPQVRKQPLTLTDPCLCFNPRYMGDFEQACHKLAGKNFTGVKVYPGKDETEPFVVRLGAYPSFYGVLMPMRTDGHNTWDATPPGWLDIEIDGFRPMDSAPKDASWVIVRLKDNTEVEAHFAENLSGEDQPPFSGWFRRSSDPGSMIAVEQPMGWKPIPKPEEPPSQPHPTTMI